jgi:hypothetical protein
VFVCVCMCVLVYDDRVCVRARVHGLVSSTRVALMKHINRNCQRVDCINKYSYKIDIFYCIYYKNVAYISRLNTYLLQECDISVPPKAEIYPAAI